METMDKVVIPDFVSFFSFSFFLPSFLPFFFVPSRFCHAFPPKLPVVLAVRVSNEFQEFPMGNFVLPKEAAAALPAWCPTANRAIRAGRRAVES